MIRLRNDHYATLLAVQDLLRSREDRMTETEKQTVSAFCDFLEEAAKDRERHKADAQASMQRFRETPEGREKERIRSQEYRNRKKTKK